MEKTDYSSKNEMYDRFKELDEKVAAHIKGEGPTLTPGEEREFEDLRTRRLIDIASLVIN